jgi:hypothetical protein
VSEASELLDRAAELYRDSAREHRDILLECGRLLHEFVISHLRGGEKMTKEERKRKGFTRDQAISAAAERMGVDGARVRDLIRASMTVDLLSEGGHVGELPWCVIHVLGRFTRCDRKTEDWQVRPDIGHDAKETFRAAAKDGMTKIEAQGITELLCKGNAYPERRKRQAHIQRKTLISLLPVIRSGSPGDVAEMLYELVRESSSPRTVMARLTELCKNTKEPRPSMADAC